MKKLFEYTNIVLLCFTGVILIALQIKPLGWGSLSLGMLELLLCRKQFAKDLLLVYLSIAILGFTPITTDISYSHIIVMGVAIFLAAAIPYAVSRYLYKNYLVRFKFHHGRGWYKEEILYIFLSVAVAYFLLPFYFQSTNAHANWSVVLTPSAIIRLFIGTNALGAWDELFFISTVLGVLRRHLPFTAANLAQAVLFTSFLYELGFIGWGFTIIFGFALIQGYIFKRTESLFYVISIHLTVDLILFLALIHAHYPNALPIFIF